MNSTKMIRQKAMASAGRLGNIKSTKENAGQTVTTEKSSKGKYLGKSVTQTKY